MGQTSLSLLRWPLVVHHLNAVMDLDDSARRHKALLRRRGVRSAADLLHLALLYGPGGLSLRGVAALAAEIGLADLCDVSLLDRLRNAGDFLAEVLARLLEHGGAGALKGGGHGPGLRLALVDGSAISGPGSQGVDWRLHARYDPAQARFAALTLTQADAAEALCRVALGPGDVVVQDRGYARLRNFTHAQAQGCDFLCRIGWNSVRLYDPAGARLDLMAALCDDGPALREHRVLIGHPSGQPGHSPGLSLGLSLGHPARLIIARKPPEATARQQRRQRRRASRQQQRTDPRTLRAAGFLMLLTSLPAEQHSAQAVMDLYRLRWQIELAFKRLKSLGGLAALPASDPRLARSWLLAHLIAAVLVETSISEGLDSPP